VHFLACYILAVIHLVGNTDGIPHPREEAPFTPKFYNCQVCRRCEVAYT